MECSYHSKPNFTDEEKEKFEWLLKHGELCSERYIEAENFISSILDMKWYQRFYFYICKKSFEFMVKQLKKYNF